MTIHSCDHFSRLPWQAPSVAQRVKHLSLLLVQSQKRMSYAGRRKLDRILVTSQPIVFYFSCKISIIPASYRFTLGSKYRSTCRLMKTYQATMSLFKMTDVIKQKNYHNLNCIHHYTETSQMQNIAHLPDPDSNQLIRNCSIAKRKSPKTGNP